MNPSSPSPLAGTSGGALTRSRWRAGLWRWQLGGALLYALVMVSAPDAAWQQWLGNLGYLVIAAPSLVMLALVAFTPPPSPPAQADVPDGTTARPAWHWLTVAVGAWFLGDLLWMLEALTEGTPPSLGLADVAYLAFYPLGLQALAVLPGLGSTAAERWRLQLDALIASLTTAALFTFLWPIPADPSGSETWLVHFLYLGYPAGDVMLLTAVTVLRLRQTPQQSAAQLGTVMFGLAVKTLADLLHARSVFADVNMVNGLTGFAWLAFYAMATRTATLSATRTSATAPAVATTMRNGRLLTWLPFVGVTLAGTLLLQVVFAGDVVAARGMAVVTVALSIAVLLRQTLVGRELRRLDQLTALGVAESRLADLVRHSHDVVMVVDADAIVHYASPSITRVLGLAPGRLQGKSGLGLLHLDDIEPARLALTRVSAHGAHTESLVLRVQHGAGGWRHLEMVATNRFDTPSINGIVLNLRDVTERRELEGRLQWQAFHDPMTGLANRVLFADRVAHAIARRQRSGSDIGVLFIDLDHFKAVNDTLGHAAGDALLREAAKRITQEVRASDTVARFGGDEFAILLEEAPLAQCRLTAERLLTQLTRGFSLDGREVFTGASIGLAMAQPGESLDDVVRNADVAMYVAKAEGRSRVVTFEGHMREQVTERLTLEADLRRALERHELSVLYQAQVDLRSGEILGAEALVRWNHPTRGFIPPSRFVPIAEQAGLMLALSRFVLHTATRDAAHWRQPGQEAPSVHVAVNLSGRHVQDPSLLADVEAALGEAGLDPSLLTIEITESVMMHNTQSAIAVLHDLKALGCKIAVDDFGTGYSSLSYLQQFPVDMLKIDKRFIDSLGTPEGEDALTRAILSLGDSLGLATVAEGIETPRQLAELQRMGCLLGQGFLLAHPLPARVFAELLGSGSIQQSFAQLPALPAGHAIA